MAKEQGTGQHAHKSSEEPYPHHEAPTAHGEKREEGRESQSGSRSSSSQSHSSSGSSKGNERRDERSNESSDLKSREYRDKDGNIHHHTHTAEATKEKGSGKDNR